MQKLLQVKKKADFIASIENSLHYFNGVPAAIVPDNLRSAVTRSDRFEPTINESLLDFADHYQTTVLPARAYKPRDKSSLSEVCNFRRLFLLAESFTIY